MKRITYVKGQYSKIKLDDGSRIFVEILPDRVRAKKMVLGIIPTKLIWEFVFPFYIRTAIEAWDSSKAILDIALESIENVKNLVELKAILEGSTSKILREYTKEHGESAREISMDKVGVHALKQILNPKDLSEIETIVHAYGKTQEKVAQEIMTKYPAMVFPKSLLPYPKEKIQKALSESLRYVDDEQMAENLKSCAVFLEGFIDDEEANKKNNELLNNKGFQDAIARQANKNNKT